MRKLLKPTLAFAAIVASAMWILSAPETLSDGAEFARLGDVEKGRDVFYAGGCASCHAAPKAEGDAKLVLTGGRKFPSAFGTFYAPNISPDSKFGIGNWTALDLANAMVKGVSPGGQHYYPAFPYTSYSRMELADIVDLHAFLNTLPSSNEINREHELPLPTRFRRALGLWKLLYLDNDVVSGDFSRGQYLVEGLGHCAECHTPRTILGGLKSASWMSGAPLSEGEGRVPNITPHADGLAHWSIDDLTEYLESGFTPDFDSASGVMVDVIENTSQLSDEDRLAIATYLKALTPIPKP
ncbi:diacylglycerol kinase [Rhodobacterales bacterium 52_120_T64]|nr:diacylglycerol kinase [Rhodobacterales bacterium 52_120_T64]